jgi:hypothetical protein
MCSTDLHSSKNYLGVSAKDTINHNTAYRQKKYIHVADKSKKTDDEYSTKPMVPESSSNKTKVLSGI